MNTAIITAAGSGERSELKINKNLFYFDGSTVIEKTAAAFLKVKNINEIIITAPTKEIKKFQKLFKGVQKVNVIEGGETRTKSVAKALDVCRGDVVLIHDGARPFVTSDLIKKCLDKAIIDDNCIPVTPLTETLGVVEDEKISTAIRKNIVTLQTPQAFKTEQIKKAYDNIGNDEIFTDDCGVYCKYIGKCNFIEGEKTNVKLTYKPDFEKLLPKKTGIGFDLHRLIENRKLVLGGVTIPHTKGLLGHSDADVLIHALMDAMLSACALKDIGNYFPDTDDKYKDISSVILLKKVLKIIKKQGYKPVSASFVIMAEKPKLSPFVDLIRQNLSTLLSVKKENLGISCTTLEGLGIIGQEEAIAAYCNVMLSPCL